MAEIERFKIEIELGATMEIEGKNWVKPGMATGITFRGIPDEEQVRLSMDFMQKNILEPAMQEMTQSMIAHTRKANGV